MKFSDVERAGRRFYLFWCVIAGIVVTAFVYREFKDQRFRDMPLPAAVEVPIEGSLTASLEDIRQSLRDEALASAPEVEGIVITASYYGEAFHGKMTANWKDRELFDMNAMTAAHRSLPIGTIVFIENLRNGRFALARINDRGPYVWDRELDVSKAVALELGMVENGVVPVRIQILRRKES